MTGRIEELRILHRKAIYPDTYGGNLRTLGLARLAQEIFSRTSIYSMDNSIDFEGIVDGVSVIQETESRDPLDKFRYFFNALVSKDLIIPYTKRAFASAEHSLFQIEDPLFYPLIKKNGISNFILDEHNVYWELSGFPQQEFKKRIYSAMASRRDKANEIEALRHAAHILCCSQRDLDVLVAQLPEITYKISIIPNCVNSRDYIISQNPPESRSGRCKILFVGLMAYAPNVQAANLICRVIAPQCPECDFIIAGKNPPRIPWCPDNVRLTGYIRDLKPVITDADICIAPLLSGSGTRLKILEYMAMGKAVISTSKGAEGIEYTDGLNIIIEDMIEKFPGIIRDLLSDDRRRRSIGREARALIQAKYDWELYRKPLENIYQSLMGDIE